MKETLLLLLELQELENSLRGLRELQENIEKIRTDNGQSIDVFERMLSENNTQLEEILTFCKQTQDEITKAADDAKRSRQRMNAITSQRELNALNKEIETARRNNQTKVEELKKLQAQYQTAKDAYEKRLADVESMKTEMKTIEDNMVAEIESRMSQSAAQRSRKEEIHGMLDKAVLSRFNRVMKNRKGVAIVGVTNEICGGCRMRVPPQQFIRIMRMNTIESCQQCSRMMVVKEAFEQDHTQAS